MNIWAKELQEYAQIWSFWATFHRFNNNQLVTPFSFLLFLSSFILL